jgi:hypothetical protein
MLTRKGFVLAIPLLVASTSVASALAAVQPTVEIIALPHWPVKDALKPVREFLATTNGHVKVVELDAETPEGEARLTALGLKGHIPILLVINGSYRFKRPDGTIVEFKDFPAKAGNPLGLNGSWTVADFKTAVKAALGEQKQ